MAWPATRSPRRHARPPTDSVHATESVGALAWRAGARADELAAALARGPPVAHRCAAPTAVRLARYISVGRSAVVLLLRFGAAVERTCRPTSASSSFARLCRSCTPRPHQLGFLGVLSSTPIHARCRLRQVCVACGMPGVRCIALRAGIRCFRAGCLSCYVCALYILLDTRTAPLGASQSLAAQSSAVRWVDTFFDNFPRMVMGSSTFSNADIVAIKLNV